MTEGEDVAVAAESELTSHRNRGRCDVDYKPRFMRPRNLLAGWVQGELRKTSHVFRSLRDEKDVSKYGGQDVRRLIGRGDRMSSEVDGHGSGTNGSGVDAFFF